MGEEAEIEEQVEEEVEAKIEEEVREEVGRRRRIGLTALIPQSCRPAQGKHSVRSCHLTQRESSKSFRLFLSPNMLSLSLCMSSSSSVSSSSCHSHCKAATIIRGVKKHKQMKRCLLFV